MVTFENKQTNLTKVTEALENSLGIVTEDNRLSTIVNKISDSRYSFKLVDETETLPISSERPSLLYKNWLYVAGSHDTGCGLVIIDTDTMKIIKQVFLSSVYFQNPVSIVNDDIYYYIAFSTAGLLVRGLLETGEVVNTTVQSVIGAARAMCVDEAYLYLASSAKRIYKIDKTTLIIAQTGNEIYNSPLDLKCVGDFIYITGTGTSPNTGVVAKIAKSDINTIVATTSNIYNSEVTSRILIDEEHLYTASVTGIIKKWLLSDLSYISDFYSNGTDVCTIKKLLGDFLIGDINGKTSRLDSDGNLLSTLTTSSSSNYVLEIDEINQILYRNARDDITIAKYQIVDNLQNNMSQTVIKTANLVSLNTAGTWADTVYTLNGMTMTCNTLSNGYLRELSFTGTTTADSEFVLAVPNVNNKLTPNKSYILNGVKSTASLSTVFIRLTQYQNPDGSGLNKVTEKIAGDFKVFIAANDDYLYYKIEIIIKSGVTLNNSLYNNIPSMLPSSITYEQGEGPYLIKDLSTITNTIFCYKLTIIDGKLFVLPTTTNAGTIEVRDYQTGELLKTINDEANVGVTGICFDNDYIYIAKGVETITDKKYRDIYVRKYNRCTLDFIAESPILYTGVSGTIYTNSSNIFGMVENGEYLYLACIQTTQVVGDFHKIRKIKKTDFSQVAEITWDTPLNIIKHENGFFVGGGNTKLSSDTKYRRVEFLDWDLNIIQTFPQTSLTIQNFRYGFYKGDYLYVTNDSGVLVKYQISTNTIMAETQISEAAVIRNIVLINDNFLLLQTNTSKIMLYDLNLNFVKLWDFYNTTTTSGQMLCDNNNTIWTQAGSQPDKIYKKQFIDLTKDIT